MAIGWGWPFPKVGEGSFLGGQLFGKNPGGEFRPNGFHNGLDFGSVDHPGSEICAIHDGTVVFAGWAPSGYEALGTVVATKSDDGYYVVYQEFGTSTANIRVSVGQKVTLGQVVATRNTSHLHLGVTKTEWLKAQSSAFSNNGVWLDPRIIIKNGTQIISKFKVGDIVGFNSQAQTWVGGKSIGADNLVREYKVNKHNAEGSLYIVTIDNAWGGNVNEKDIEISKRSRLFKLGELVGFKEQATTWTSGKAIGADNLARDYKVAKLNNDGTIYIKTTDDAWGGNAREQDIAISKRSKKVKVNDNVGFNTGASTWTSGKAIGEDNLARDYKVTKLLVDGTVLITTLDNSWSGLVYDKDIEINQRSKTFKVGEVIRFNSLAATWTSGTAIGADNLKREYVITKLYVDGTIYVRTTDNAWGGNVFGKDIELSRRIKLNDVVRFINFDAVWTSGKPIGADNLLRDYIVKGFNSDGTVYLTVPDNSWGGNVYYKDIDVKK